MKIPPRKPAYTRRIVVLALPEEVLHLDTLARAKNTTRAQVIRSRLFRDMLSKARRP